MFESLKEALAGTLRRFGEKTLEFLPNLLAMVIIVIVGFITAAILRWGIRRALKAIKFDEWCDKTGSTQLFVRADIRSAPSVLLTRGLFWLVFLAFFIVGLSSLEVTVVNNLLARLFGYLPQVFAAAFILVGGFLIANFLSRAALLAAVNANMASPRLLAGGVKFLIAILAFSMALEQLQIARNIVTAAFAIAFGAVMLGLAIAFGLGGRDVARQVLERRFLEKKEAKPDEFSHI